MTRYQKNHYNDYNDEDYADFTDVGGDCTNYASQILREGGSAFNSSSNSGIMGEEVRLGQLQKILKISY